MATRLGLAIDSARSEAVMVTTCYYFHTKGMAHKVSVWLQGYAFTSDFDLLAVAVCNMVLDVNWLEALGFTGWNFFFKVMKFSVHGTNYVCQGQSRNQGVITSNKEH